MNERANKLSSPIRQLHNYKYYSVAGNEKNRHNFIQRSGLKMNQRVSFYTLKKTLNRINAPPFRYAECFNIFIDRSLIKDSIFQILFKLLADEHILSVPCILVFTPGLPSVTRRNEVRVQATR